MNDRLRAILTLRREPDDLASAFWFGAGCGLIFLLGMYLLVTA